VGAIIGKSVVEAFGGAGGGEAPRLGRAGVNETRNVVDIAAGHFSYMGRDLLFWVNF
jgi:hypothetical protein